MADTKITKINSIKKLVDRLRDDLNTSDFVLLFAFNGVGKTRASVAFKNKGKISDTTTKDTLYYNAFTEDLFSWENDLENDNERYLKINENSSFFDGLKELALDDKIFSFLENYANIDFRIDYETWRIVFSKVIKNPEFNDKNPTNTEPEFVEKDSIKISRGEENIFIWSVFLAICQLVIDEDPAYSWVKYIYIDDPISSLDDNNCIAIAADLAKLIKQGAGNIKTVISTHHSLFYNVMFNELRKEKTRNYFLDNTGYDNYTLRKTEDTPFFHHVATLSELKEIVENDNLKTYHFNALRSVLEKTATFFNVGNFREFIKDLDGNLPFERALHLLSHGNYSVFNPVDMQQDNKILFKQILDSFLNKYDEFGLVKIESD